MNWRSARLLLPLLLLLSTNILRSGELFRAGPLSATNQAVLLTPQAVPLQPGRKHCVTLLASTDNTLFTVEANSRIRETGFDDRASRLRLEFIDAEGKACGDIDILVISRKAERYGRVFHPPARATTMHLRLIPGKGGSAIACQTVDVIANPDGVEAACINVHPRFEYGDLNFYGHRPGGGGTFLTRPDGVTVWNSGFIGFTPAFPVKGGAYYTLTVRAKGYDKGNVLLDCYREGEEKSFKSMNVKFSESSVQNMLQMPEGAARAQLRCYYIILEEFRVSESNDQPMPEAVTQKGPP
jgi:hypothetical protein